MEDRRNFSSIYSVQDSGTVEIKREGLHAVGVGKISLQFKPYCRKLAVPLKTSHGYWKHREGILLRLEDESGRTGFGEVAPLEAFLTESVGETLGLLKACQGSYDQLISRGIPPGFPATEMALWSALNFLREPQPPSRRFSVTALLPSGEEAISRIAEKVEAGYQSFKWKIGVYPLEREFGWLNRLIEELPPRGKLRLDANGGLRPESFRQWLQQIESIPQLEFLEQPLPPAEQNAMLEESRPYGVQIALDESVSQVDSLLQALISGWTGLLVIKPSIVGSPFQYLQWQTGWERDFVFSSAFETAVGMESALRLISLIPEGDRIRSLGFGTNAYFEADGFSLHGNAPEIAMGEISLEEMQELWNRL